MATNAAAAPAPEPLARSPKVLGILSIIFASITLLGSFISIIGSLGARDFARLGMLMREADNPEQAAIFESLFGTLSGVYDVALINSIIFMVMSGALLAFGIGQLRYRRWARVATIYWSIAALLSLVVMSILFITVVGPIYDRVAEVAAQYGGNPRAAALLRGTSIGPMASAGGALFMVLFFAPYPIILWSLFTRDIVKRSMTS